MAYSIDIRENLSGTMAAIRTATTPVGVNAIIGRTVQQRLRNHFFEREQKFPNKLGGRRTHFWAQAARSVQYQVENDRVIVSVNHVGVRQRLQGGRITARNAKLLTIPATAEAHGKRAGEWNNLKIAVINGKLALVEREATAIRIGKKGVRALSQTTGRFVIYWLKRSVVQAPDPTVMPSNEELQRTAVVAADEHVKAFLRRQEGQK